MSGLLSPRFENRSVSAYRVPMILNTQSFIKNFDDFNLAFESHFNKLDSINQLKKTLTTHQLTGVELSLGQHQLERLTPVGFVSTRFENHSDPQKNLVLRCEGILGSIWESIMKMLDWIGEKISSLFGGGGSKSGGGGGSSPAENRKDSIELKKEREEELKKLKQEIENTDKRTADLNEKIKVKIQEDVRAAQEKYGVDLEKWYKIEELDSTFKEMLAGIKNIETLCVQNATLCTKAYSLMGDKFFTLMQGNHSSGRAFNTSINPFPDAKILMHFNVSGRNVAFLGMWEDHKVSSAVVRGDLKPSNKKLDYRDTVIIYENLQLLLEAVASMKEKAQNKLEETLEVVKKNIRSLQDISDQSPEGREAKEQKVYLECSKFLPHLLKIIVAATKEIDNLKTLYDKHGIDTILDPDNISL